MPTIHRCYRFFCIPERGARERLETYDETSLFGIRMNNEKPRNHTQCCQAHFKSLRYSGVFLVKKVLRRSSDERGTRCTEIS